MKERDLISIVVPVYNVEKYLEKCINSIINQTYKNIEIILVDDGSTDDSGKLCDELKKKDNRIKVFHKKNGGLSDARNFGIEKASGKYIGFIDSDDFIKEDMYEILYNAIITTKADLSMCEVIDCYGEIVNVENTHFDTFDLAPEEAIKKVMEAERVSVHAVSKLYKKSLFDNDLKFEVGKTAEDAIIMVELFSNCKKIAYVTAKEYYYIHRENSITTKKFNPNNGYDVIYAYNKNYDIIKNKYPMLLDVAKTRLCWAHFFVLDSMVKSNYKIDMKIVKYLRNNFLFIMKNKYFTKSRKISMLFLIISVKLYCVIAKIFYKRKRKLTVN